MPVPVLVNGIDVVVVDVIDPMLMLLPTLGVDEIIGPIDVHLNVYDTLDWLKSLVVNVNVSS